MTSKNNKQFAERLKSLRKIKGITQSELSQKARLDYRHYQDIESGKVNISIDTIKCIAAALSVKNCYLLNFEKNTTFNSMNILCPADLLGKLSSCVQICDMGGNVLYDNSIGDLTGCGEENCAHKVKVKIWDSITDPTEKERMQKYFESNAQKMTTSGGSFHTFDDIDNRKQAVTINWSYLIGNEGHAIGFVCMKIPGA